MKTAITHRGPDDHGTYADENIVLGHRRLSIIDLGGGRQPLENEDGSIISVVNGEIYNFSALRKTLEQKGHRFATRSDSEVLVHLYEEKGVALLEDIIGMYAFALWDRGTRTLFLARDRFGQKPLYYAERSGQIIFASELKSLLCHPKIERDIHAPSLSRYLAYEYVPAPESIYTGVSKLEAGCCLVWKDGKSSISRYWNYPIASKQYRGTLSACCREVRNHLEESVKKRLVSDVPLGVFLSGGIDSSALVALMSRHISPQNIKTFCIGFREASFDESSYARIVADHFGTDHHEMVLSAERMLDILPQVIAQFDEPFADASAIPTYLLSEFTRQTVKVALGGDGGDELFAGYDPFPAHRMAGWFEKLPRPVNEGVFRTLARMLSPSDDNMSLEFRTNKFFNHLYEHPVRRNQLWLGTFDAEKQCALWQSGTCPSGDPYGDLESILESTRSANALDAIIYAYTRTYLTDGILVKIDRASMVHSLEVRSPFLDHRFAEFAASVPVRWKLRGFSTKYLLKKAFQRILPPAILRRRKKGFGIPKAKWLRINLRDQLEHTLSRDNCQDFGFRYAYVRKLMDEHFKKQRDHQKELWTLLMLGLWYRSPSSGSVTQHPGDWIQPAPFRQAAVPSP